MNYLPLTYLMTTLLLSGAAQAVDGQAIVDKGPASHIQFANENIDWQAAPKSLEAGAKIAVLEGNPAEAGLFTMRIKMPDGFRISPHWHPNVERVTVLSGTFRHTFDVSKTEALPAGSYTSMPPKMCHFAVAEGETSVQLTSIGPWVVHYIDPQDDPRLRD